jgi:transcriptional regulator with XRE-family HTH domain
MGTRGKKKREKPWFVEETVPGLGTERVPIGYESLMLSSKPNLSGKNLKDVRKSLGMTQAELAKRAGVSQSLITAVERGVEQKGTDITRRRIANELVQAEFDRSIGKYGTPDPVQTIKQRESRIAVLERDLKIRDDYIKKLEEEKKELLGMLGWRIKKTVEDSEQSEAEQKLMDKIGAEKIPPVEEEALRAEIVQRGRPKGHKEK